MMSRTSHRLRIAAVALGFLPVLAACGGGSDTDTVASATSAPTGAQFPVTVESAAGPLTLEERPERIVSLSPTATESLFAVGAGDQVVAVDDQSSYPEEAPRTDLSGFTPSAEAVAGYRPDLVVLSDDLAGIVESLQTLDLPVLVQPAAQSLDEAWAQIEAIGDATGHGAAADELVADLQQRVDEAVASVPDEAEGWTVYHELDDTLYSATSDTFIGKVEAAMGLENIADAASTGGNTYPQLSAEYVVQAAPDVVVLADTVCCGQTAETFAARPGFADLPAVREGRVLEVDDSIASRWGPRIADFAEQLAALLSESAG